MELNVAVNNDTYALQTQFRELYYADLLPLIEAEMDRLAPGDEVIVIDRLELDLGKVIQNASLDQVVKERLIKALEEQFFPIRYARDEGKTKGEIKLESTSGEAEWRKESKILTNFEAFIAFLESGAIPWGISIKGWDENASSSISRVNALVEEILNDKFHELVAYIKRNADYTRVQQRIYHHFSADQIKRLVLQALASDLGVSIKQLNELQKELLMMAGVTMSNNSREEKAIWWSLYLIFTGIKTQAIHVNSLLPLIKQELERSKLSHDPSPEKVKWTKKSKNLSSFEAFILFLESGALPIGSTIESGNDNGTNSTSRINALIEEIMEERFFELVMYIKRNISYTRVQQRIYSHFSADQLRKLVLQALSYDLSLSETQLHELQKELMMVADLKISSHSREEKAIWWSLFLIVAGIKTQAIRLNSILPLFITLIKQEFGQTKLSLRDLFTFIEKQPENAKQIIDLFSKMGVDLPATLGKIGTLSKSVATNAASNRDQSLSQLLEMRKNVFQLHEILPIIDNDWFLEWNEMIQSEKKKLLEESTIETFTIRKESKNEENSASKIVEEVGISVENSGLVILAYFLPHLFDHLGWIKDKQIREEALPKALSMTQFLATGEEIVDESALVLNKLILGIDLDDPMTNDYILSDVEKELGIDLLKNVITRWEALRSVSVAGFQQTFLKRDGIVYFRDNQYLLRVEKKTVDILMEKIPWSIGVIKLSWMPKMMITEW